MAGPGRLFITIVIAVLGLLSPAQATERLSPEEAVGLINDLRASSGVQPVALDPTLAQVARLHSLDMAVADEVSHIGRDGSDLAARLRFLGYDPFVSLENLSGGQRDMDEVLADMMASDTHRANLLDPRVTEIGIAVTYDRQTSYRTFWTLILAEPY